jgi:hypothetical protein
MQRQRSSRTDPASTPVSAPKYLAPKQVAARYGVKVDVVLSWIWSRQLEAVDVRSAGARRARWRISTDAVERFEISRTRKPPAPRPAVRRRRYLPAVADVFGAGETFV